MLFRSHEPRTSPALLLGPRQANPRLHEQLAPITVVDDASDVAALDAATESWSSTFTDVQPELVEVLPPDPWTGPTIDPSGRTRDVPTGTILTALRTLDAGVAVLLSHLGGRRDAVVVVSTPRWSSVPSHRWATARLFVRPLPCQRLVVPAVAEEERHPAPDRRTQP